MNITEYTVYWMQHGAPCCYQTTELQTVLERLAELRKQTECTFVTFAAQNYNQVGKMGVDSVENGLTPVGDVYDWVKHRDSR